MLLGVTLGGGADGNGTVFQLAPPVGGTAWTESVLYNFKIGQFSPSGALFQDSAGALFGTIQGGGTGYYNGAAFQLSPPTGTHAAWSEKTIYNFAGGLDGATPSSALVHDSATGALYGVTNSGGGMGCSGDRGCGTAFSLTPPSAGNKNWQESVLHRFGKGKDGATPAAQYLIDGGNLYGTTESGGAHGYGTVFVITP